MSNWTSVRPVCRQLAGRAVGAAVDQMVACAGGWVLGVSGRGVSVAVVVAVLALLAVSIAGVALLEVRRRDFTHAASDGADRGDESGFVLRVSPDFIAMNPADKRLDPIRFAVTAYYRERELRAARWWDPRLPFAARRTAAALAQQAYASELLKRTQ